jgi:TetR/AcrR family transcriptional repressor of nem operon
MDKLSKAAKTKEYIVRIASPIFNMKGFAGTALSDLTEATGLTKGAIYGHFDGKQDIALEVLEYHLKTLQEKIRRQMSRATNSRERLLIYIETYRKINSSIFPKGGCPILNTAVDADDTNPTLKARVSDAISNWKERIASIIEDGIAHGEFKRVDAQGIALTLIALIEGGVMIRMLTGRQDYYEIVLERIESIIDEITA